MKMSKRFLKPLIAVIGALVLAVGLAQTSSGQAFYSSIIFRTTGKLLLSSTAPTIVSGFGNTPSIASSNGAATFQVNVGTGGSASQGVIGMPTASNGWNCVINGPAGTFTRQTAQATTNVTVDNYTSTTVHAAWAASAVLNFVCAGY